MYVGGSLPLHLDACVFEWKLGWCAATGVFLLTVELPGVGSHEKMECPSVQRRDIEFKLQIHS